MLIELVCDASFSLPFGMEELAFFFAYNLKIMEKFYTTKEAADILKLSCSGMYKLVQAGRIKYYQPGGKVMYFAAADIEKYITGGPSNESAI